MATFIKDSDIPWVLQGFSVHPSSTGWRDWVIAHTTDTDVVDLVNAMADGLSLTLPEGLVDEVRRVADTDSEIELTRTDVLGTGETVTFQAKGRGFI